jgi:hypothetical protein
MIVPCVRQACKLLTRSKIENHGVPRSNGFPRATQRRILFCCCGTPWFSILLRVKNPLLCRSHGYPWRAAAHGFGRLKQNLPAVHRPRLVWPCFIEVGIPQFGRRWDTEGRQVMGGDAGCPAIRELSSRRCCGEPPRAAEAKRLPGRGDGTRLSTVLRPGNDRCWRDPGRTGKPLRRNQQPSLVNCGKSDRERCGATLSTRARRTSC